MKNLFITLVVLIPIVSKAQIIYDAAVTFENNVTSQYIRINTGSTNCWQIGQPAKPVFSSAFSQPNAIVTDTLNSYPINNHSIFYLTIKDLSWFNGSPSILSFQHQYNTDVTKDGGYIEVSYDGGANWQNVLFDTILLVCPMSPPFAEPMYMNFYCSNDTIVGGIPAFTGNSNGWKETSISWMFCMGVKQFPPDSVMFAFHFISDSLQTNKDGWMIDNISLVSYLCSNIDDFSKNNIIITPNPATDFVEIYNAKNAEIQLLDSYGRPLQYLKALNGKEIITISELQKGIYLISIKNNNYQKLLKLIKQ